MNKFLICLVSFLLGMSIIRLFSCEGEDFAHFRNRMYVESIENNLRIADKHLTAHEYQEAHEYFLMAEEQYKFLTFPSKELKKKIDIGVMITELKE